MENIRLSTTLGILLTLHNTGKFKKLHDLVVRERWSVKELVIVIVHLAQKSKHIIYIYIVHDIVNCDILGVVLLGDNVDYHSKSGI